MRWQMQCVAMANAACSVATCSALPCTMLRTACFLAPRFASFLAPLLFLDNHHEPFALSPFVICSVGFRSRFHLLRSCARGRWSMQGWWFKGLGEEGRGGSAMLLLRISRARVYKKEKAGWSGGEFCPISQKSNEAPSHDETSLN